MTSVIARRIMDAAKAGERDPARLCASAIKDLGAWEPPPRQPAETAEGLSPAERPWGLEKSFPPWQRHSRLLGLVMSCCAPLTRQGWSGPTSMCSA